MRLLILAGGFGTRLNTAVPGVPKALAPVGGVPFLEFQIEHWLAQGLTEFTFLLHHQADHIIAFLKARRADMLKDCQVDWIIEPRPMDTGGAVAHAVNSLDLKGRFLMTNADTWLGSGISELIQSTTPAMAVINVSDVTRYGQVYFDEDKRVTAFAEKKGQCVSGWINAGLCHLNAELFKKWDGQPFSLERELFVTLVQNRSLMAVPLQTDFVDIGMPDDYHRFCCWAAAGRNTSLCN